MTVVGACSGSVNLSIDKGKKGIGNGFKNIECVLRNTPWLAGYISYMHSAVVAAPI